MACSRLDENMSIIMPRGDIREVLFNVYVDDQGQEVIYTDDFDEIYFTVKELFEDEEYLFQKRLTSGTITKDEESTYHLTIEAQDTNELEFGEYVFDIELVAGSTIKQTTTGKLVLSYESTYASNEV